MKLQEAQNLFESLKTVSTKKTEIKIYKRFLQILSKLSERNFTNDEIESIETELDNLNLDSKPEHRKKFFRKALQKFQKYLKEAFSLTQPDYYVTMGSALGVAFGPVLGVIAGQFFNGSLSISMGISLGLLIGTMVGIYLDSQAKAVGNII